MAIATLTGDNGVLTKAGNAKNTSTEAEVLEKLKLAYEDYYLGQHATSGYTFQNAVDKMFGTGVATALGPDSNGIYTVTVNGKTYKFNQVTGKAEEYVYVDPFNYGTGKTKETIQVNDDIILQTEKFKVFSVSNTEIKAVPYYNIDPVLNNTKQNPNYPESIAFADHGKKYWGNGDGDIDMFYKLEGSSNYENNIQQYIDAYKTTLQTMGAEMIEVRIPRKSELIRVSGLTALNSNPSQRGYYWVGTYDVDEENNLYIIEPKGQSYAPNDNFARVSYGYPYAGIRPILIIKK